MTDGTKLNPPSEFDGCDGGDPGSPKYPSIWLFGIEHGVYKSRHDPAFQDTDDDDTYSVQTQLKWPYNRNAFKLLAAIEGVAVKEFRNFAESRQPFVHQSKGYFKGNLFPFACRSVSEWPIAAKAETGMSKAQYREWCTEHHLPEIKKWVDKYQPKIFIGVGTTNRQEFSRAALGKEVEFEVFQFPVNGHEKRIFHAKLDNRRLVVVPHLSGSRHGLNSNESLQKAGEFIANLLEHR
jgi:hypothetical protein